MIVSLIMLSQIEAAQSELWSPIIFGNPWSVL